ncbi:MAG: helix-turn-helix domain-containing protein [Chitinivibrionales bacterium]|nr:helix-turn-helix domain-containing protein [Chitinivibrionales bacterium]
MMYIGDWYETDAEARAFRVGSEVTEKPGFVIDRPRGCDDYDLVHFTAEALIRLDGVEQRVAPGGCILYSPDHPQWYTGGSRPLVHDWLHFSDLAEYPYVERFGPPVNRILYPTTTRLITDSIRQIYYELTLKRDRWEYVTEALVRNLLVVLRRAAQGDMYPPHGSEDRLMQIRYAVHRQPERPWRVSEMAAMAALSRPRFSVLYKRFFGVSPLEEVIQLRLQRARRLLTSTSWSVDHVARESGFQDPAYFNRLFKKRFGVTPGRYQ